MQPLALTRRFFVALLSGTVLVVACGEAGQKITVPDETQTGEGEGEGEGGAGGQGGEEAVCPHVGDPLVDPASFMECPTCTAGGAVCIPKVLLPPENLSSFSDCDADNACVPNIIVASRGNFIPSTCESVFGAEGRCLSKCLPSVADKADTLPQSSCSASDACVPCFDPFTQEPTGACDQSCDPGPAEPPVTIPSCCMGEGVCLPTETVGEKAKDLGQDNCAQNEGERVCVPTQFLDPTTSPMTCVDTFFFSDYPGVCLPECLPAVQGLLADVTLDQQGCPDNHVCAPCDNPVTGNSTGACDL